MNSQQDTQMAQPAPSILPVIGGIGFVIFGVVFLQPVHAITQTLTNWYDPHPGTITKLVVVDDQITSIEYSYVIDGRRYFGERISYAKGLEKNEIERAVGQLEKGAPVTVYADQHDSAQCVLIRGLTQSGQFGLAWSILAILGAIATIFHFVIRSRSKEDLRRDYEDQVEHQAGVKRLRLVPGGFKSPASVAVTCLVASAVLFYGLLELGDRLFGWWDLRTNVKISVSLAIAMAAAVFDYFYTLRGNERGRWDLVVDENAGTLQLPAIGPYGQPTEHKLEEVAGLQLKTLLRPEDCDNNEGLYRLNIICRQHKLSPHDIPCESVTTHAVAQSENRTELEALAEWLKEAVGPCEIEEAVSDRGIAAIVSELRRTSQSY